MILIAIFRVWQIINLIQTLDTFWKVSFHPNVNTAAFYNHLHMKFTNIYWSNNAAKARALIWYREMSSIEVKSRDKKELLGWFKSNCGFCNDF